MYTREQAIKAYLENLPDNDLYNLVVEEANYHNDGYLSDFDWEPMEDNLDTALSGNTPTEILYKEACGDFDINAELFKFDACANLESSYPCNVVKSIRDDVESGEYSDILRYFEDAYSCECGDDTFDSILQADSDDEFDDDFDLIDTEDDENE